MKSIKYREFSSPSQNSSHIYPYLGAQLPLFSIIIFHTSKQYHIINFRTSKLSYYEKKNTTIDSCGVLNLNKRQ